MTISSSKCVTRDGRRGNTTEIKFRGSVNHVTLMPVLSAAGQVFNPLIVLPGVKANFRQQVNGKFETLNQYLPSPHYLFKRPVAGVDSDIFFLGHRILFVKKSTLGRR